MAKSSDDQGSSIAKEYADQDGSGSQAPGDSDSSASNDVVLIHGQTDDGALKILRQKDTELSLGTMRPLEHGVPVLGGELLRLKPRESNPLVCDVIEETALPSSSSASSGASDQSTMLPPRTKGPSRVSSPRYRAGWEDIWGAGNKTPDVTGTSDEDSGTDLDSSKKGFSKKIRRTSKLLN